jgi:tocopherol cyclase
MIRLFHPCLYQGPENFHRTKGYFEGWYFKFVSPRGQTLALIPGVSLGKDDPHGFIQIIDGNRGSTDYIRFPLEDIVFEQKPFRVGVGGNSFSLTSLELGDRIPVIGRIELSHLRTYKTTLLRPGIMGWYRYVPGMECYHGLISTGHDLKGELLHGENAISFTNGRGYIEKDWGSSFPDSYIWMQSNSFEKKEVSFMLSHAHIPWFGNYFWGFLGYLDLGSEIITFSTHTRSVLHLLSQDENSVTLRIKGRRSIYKDSLNKGEELLVTCSRERSGELIAPRAGAMNRSIRESIDGKIRLELKRSVRKSIILEGDNAGFEMVD